MPHDPNGFQFRNYLERLSYPEYAHQSALVPDGKAAEVLDLSLWRDELPPGVAEAVLDALPKAVGTYSLAQDAGLLALLAQRLDVSPDNIMITAGADDALRAAAYYCIRPGTPVLIPTPCFGRYAYHAMVNEANINYLPFDAYPYEFDVARIADAADRAGAGCIFMASPNNPTGHAVRLEAIRRLLDDVSCAVILDESLLPTIDGESKAALIHEHPNVFICGSFSKSYGLAGLRIGYLVANRVHTKQLRQLLSPFAVDGLALAIAKHVIMQRAWLRQRGTSISKGIAVLRSLDGPLLRVTHTQAPVALLDYRGDKGGLHQLLREAGVLTVAGREFPGLVETNTVRVIIRNVPDVLRLKRIVSTIL